MYYCITEALEWWSHFLALVLIFLTRTETDLSRISCFCYLGYHYREHWWLMRSPYYLACCDLQSCLESQICMTSSLVFYPEVSRFSLKSEARLDKEKSRDFPLLLKNFIHFSSQIWSDRRGLPDDKVFFTKRNNPGDKLSLLYCLGGLRKVRPKTEEYIFSFIIWSL